MKKDEVELDKMYDALSAIAHEIQTCNSTSITDYTPNMTENEEIFKQVLKFKSILASKNKIIKELQDNIKIACVVIKTLSGKENETVSLKNLLHSTKCECADLYQKNMKTSQDILRLSEQNKALQNKLDTITNCIEFGFKQLPKSSMYDNNESSIMNKLKGIIIYSGKCLADISVKCESNLQLEQDNRFLKYKMNNLNNYNEILSKKLKYLIYENIILQKEKTNLKNISKTILINGDRVSCSELWNDDHRSIKETTMNDIIHMSADRNLNLSVHLSIAKKLLQNQNELLRHLKYLTQEVTIT